MCIHIRHDTESDNCPDVYILLIRSAALLINYRIKNIVPAGTIKFIITQQYPRRQSINQSIVY